MILWKPVIDAVDRAMFAWSELEGWTATAGWTGQDIFAPTYWYTLEELCCGEGAKFKRRAILWKFLQFGKEKYHIKPDNDFDQVEMEEAAKLLGYTTYTTEILESGGCWIIPME